MFSDKTSEVLMDLSSFSEKPVNNLSDLGLFLEIGISEDKLEELEKLSFTAKYINGLRTVMQKDIHITEPASDVIKKEFTDNIGKLKSIIETFITNSDENVIQMFKQKYLQLNQESFLNLLTFIEDLSLFKEFSNRNKSKMS